MKRYCRKACLLMFGVAVCFFVSCSRSGSVPPISEKENALQAIPEKKNVFQKVVFTNPKYGFTITLISETECEFKMNSEIRLEEYTRDDNRLRIVRRGMETSVSYYDILPEGLRESDTNEIYLLPEPLKEYRGKEHAAQEAEQARQRAVQQAEADRQRAAAIVEQKKEEDLITSRDSIIQDVRKFLANGTVFNLNYFSWLAWTHKDPNLPVQITITGEFSFQDWGFVDSYGIFGPNGKKADCMDPMERVFAIPAHFKWLGESEIFPYAGYKSNTNVGMKEYDGLFIGAIKIQDKGGVSPTWRVVIKYCIRDMYWPKDWKSAVNESVWDGTQFKGEEEKAAINLLASQRGGSFAVASPNVVAPRTVSQNRFLESTAPIVEPQQNQVFSMPLPKMSFTRK